MTQFSQLFYENSATESLRKPYDMQLCLYVSQLKFPEFLRLIENWAQWSWVGFHLSK